MWVVERRKHMYCTNNVHTFRGSCRAQWHQQPFELLVGKEAGHAGLPQQGIDHAQDPRRALQVMVLEEQGGRLVVHATRHEQRLCWRGDKCRGNHD